MVTTPDGSPVAMVHSNNGSSEIDAWVALFVEFARLAGTEVPVPTAYDLLYRNAMTGDADGGGLLAYNTLSGEVRAAISDLAVLKYEVLKKVGDAVGNTQAYQL